MLTALKAIYEMFKSACEGHAAKESADEKELVKHREEIAVLREANDELVTEQTKAIAMIEEMAEYLKKH